jgi:hypothetical protein
MNRIIIYWKRYYNKSLRPPGRILMIISERDEMELKRLATKIEDIAQEVETFRQKIVDTGCNTISTIGYIMIKRATSKLDSAVNSIP